MKRVFMLVVCFALLFCSTIASALKENSIVYCSNNGEYSSKGGSYVEKKRSGSTWGYVSLRAEPAELGDGNNAELCYSTAAYLYSRETADRVTNVGKSDVYESHGYAHPSGTEEILEEPIQYVKSSYAVLHRMYKTVVKMQGVNGYQPNRIYLYTVP